jgi:acyl-CoA-binding protein
VHVLLYEAYTTGNEKHFKLYALFARACKRDEALRAPGIVEKQKPGVIF